MPGAARANRSEPPRKLHRPRCRTKAEAGVELLGSILVIGDDPKVPDSAGRLDRCASDRRAKPVAPVFRVDVDVGDLGPYTVVLELREGHG